MEVCFLKAKIRKRHSHQGTRLRYSWKICCWRCHLPMEPYANKKSHPLTTKFGVVYGCFWFVPWKNMEKCKHHTMQWNNWQFFQQSYTNVKNTGRTKSSTWLNKNDISESKLVLMTSILTLSPNHQGPVEMDPPTWSCTLHFGSCSTKPADGRAPIKHISLTLLPNLICLF